MNNISTKTLSDVSELVNEFERASKEYKKAQEISESLQKDINSFKDISIYIYVDLLSDDPQVITRVSLFEFDMNVKKMNLISEIKFPNYEGLLNFMIQYSKSLEKIILETKEKISNHFNNILPKTN